MKKYHLTLDCNLESATHLFNSLKPFCGEIFLHETVGGLNMISGDMPASMIKYIEKNKKEYPQIIKIEDMIVFEAPKMDW